ncbi:MAG: Fur family transcriptional regulator [Anaerolineae bacterium]|nr:transcriptional repressor [Anaerolineae bacterium]MDW8100219.1 Fur family transcriptional regulator [Anaerolineae bacterium]
MSCYQQDAEALRASGYRLTPQRLMVLEALYHHPGHATADEVWARVRARHPYVDLSTVYRALQFLKERGLVGELRLAGEPAQYEAVHRRPHAHAVCRACGNVLEVPITWLAGLVSELVREHGFQADVEHLDIPGLCAHCADQEHTS